MRRIALIIGSLAIILAGGGALVWRPAPPKPTGAGPAVRSGTESTVATVRRDRPMVAREPRWSASEPSNDGTRVAPSREPQQADPARERDAWSEAGSGEMLPEEIAGQLEDRLWGEAYDGGWAPAIEGGIVRAFADSGVSGSQLTDASCRSTLCRVEVRHENPAAERDFLAAFGSQGLEYDGEQAFHLRVSGPGESASGRAESRTLFYFTRRGYPLPLLAFD